jgi:hypothetical protein
VLTGPTEWDEGEAIKLIEALLAELPATADSDPSRQLTPR